MTQLTIASILAKIKQDLDWRGPSDKRQGHIVLSYEEAEYLRDTILKIIIERDELLYKLEREAGK
jgi:hypothetical protein